MKKHDKDKIIISEIALPKINKKTDFINEMSNKPLREVVFETIREAIINGDLQPGQRLMEVQIAEQLGVSRTPVRESIRKLELEGFVSMVPRKGAYVTPFSIDDLKDMMQIRGSLEALAARLAAERAVNLQINALKQSNNLFEKAAREDDLDGIINNDILFHEVLYEASGNHRLHTMINSLREQMQRMRVIYVNCIEDKMPLIGQHDAIISAIEEHDAEKAEIAAMAHIVDTEEDMLKVLSDKAFN